MTKYTIAIFYILFNMNAHSFQGDIEDIAVQCIGCHGVSNNTRLLGFPNIAGQPSKYISEKLHDFKSGAKKSRIMRRVAARLTDQEIIDISNYFSNIKTKKTISTREYIGAGKDIFEKGIKGSVVACIKCHKLTVSKSKGYIPTLNLHHPIYIAKRLRQFRNNDSLKILTAGEKLMSFVASNLSDEDITSVSEYIGASK